LIEVVVAKTDLPIGEELRAELMEVELRPETNVALMGQYTTSDTQEYVGQFARVNISKGQEILKPMVAYNPNEIASFGSDLALYLNQGTVAVAFPINKFSGAAYALRPGDLVDAMMTMRFIDIDPEFRTALPNLVSRVFEPDLLAGSAFLFPEPSDPAAIVGRLEHLNLINKTVEIIPANPFSIPGEEGAADIPRAIPKRVTQLTVQQAEVIWVGTWRGPLDEQGEEEILAAPSEDLGGASLSLGDGGDAASDGEEKSAAADATPLPVRFENTPDVVILSMFPQDALSLKWAMDRGIDIDLVLRSQGDAELFTTISVSLPQLVNHSGWIITEGSTVDLLPHPEDAKAPYLEPVTLP
jgi:Flp pilus assembly protein CpaB